MYISKYLILAKLTVKAELDYLIQKSINIKLH